MKILLPFILIYSGMKWQGPVVFIYNSLGSCMLIGNVIQDYPHFVWEQVLFLSNHTTFSPSFLFSLIALIPLVMEQFIICYHLSLISIPLGIGFMKHFLSICTDQKEESQS